MHDFYNINNNNNKYCIKKNHGKYLLNDSDFSIYKKGI